MEGEEMEGKAGEGMEEGMDREYERKGWREVERSMHSPHALARLTQPLQTSMWPVCILLLLALT